MKNCLKFVLSCNYLWLYLLFSAPFLLFVIVTIAEGEDKQARAAHYMMLASKENVGMEACKGCHELAAQHWSHTVHAMIGDAAPTNDNQSVNCESCHGPGSAHVVDPAAPETIVRFSRTSVTPVAVQNSQCLACHDGGERMHWTTSQHESADLACSDCHNPMGRLSENGLLARAGVNETCMMCHKEQRVDFRRRSHMPLFEGKIDCTDCHNPHGSAFDIMLRTPTVNETCYGCHAEKRGPFLFEHAPVQENCLNCHNPHGSNHEKLLITARPILCQQCHAMTGHVNDLLVSGNLASGGRPDPRIIGRSCQNCHVAIHGSNHSAGSKFHR